MRYTISTLESLPTEGDFGLSKWKTVKENVSTKESAIAQAERIHKKTNKKVRIVNDGDGVHFSQDIG